jgi:hypothetical protein
MEQNETEKSYSIVQTPRERFQNTHWDLDFFP